MVKSNIAGRGLILVRADAGVNMGTGHVMRCLALAQAWQDSCGRAFFAMAHSTPAVEDRLQRENMGVARLRVDPGSADDARQTIALAQEKQAAWVVVDGYCFAADYQAALKRAGLKVLFVDDNGHAGHYSADLVLNQNAHASEGLYQSRDASTRLLLGPRFALLRREFKAWREWKREIPEVARKILVTMGGSDPANLTTRVIEAIRQPSSLDTETVILVGGSNPHLRDVEASLQRESMRLIVDAENVPEWMAWADVALAGAGTTFWEMCFFGLPGILLVLAENQEEIAAAAEEMEATWNLGKGTGVSASELAGKLAELIDSQEVRTRQSLQGRKLVDGRGAERVVAFLAGLELRRAVPADCEAYWEWANEPGARAASFRDKTISWEHHTQWFEAKLADPHAILYTAMSADGSPIGEVRYQVSGNRAVLSIGLDASHRGHGWGRHVLRLGIERLFQDCDVEFIDAYVKPQNEASLKLFAGAGFQRLAQEFIEGQQAVRFVLGRKAA